MAREARQKIEPAFAFHSRDRLDAPDPLAGGYESVADLLRRTREQYGEDLLSVAEALRIRYAHLEAIEEGRFRDLPGSTYAIGFVRSYAEFLGLDGVEIVERFKDEVEGLNRQTQLVFPTPVPEGKVPGGALILISVVLLAVAYGGWSYLSRTDTTIADLIPPVPEHLQSLGGDAEELAPDEAADSQTVAGREALSPSVPAETPAPTSSFAETDVTAPADRRPARPEAQTQVTATAAEDPADPGLAADGQSSDSAAPEGSDPTSGTAETLISGPTAAQAAPSEAEEDALSGPSQRAAGTASEVSPDAAEAQAPAPSDASQETASAAAGRERAVPGETNPPAAESFDAGAERDIPAAPQLALGSSAREPQIYGADNEDARIILRAMHDSWVQVRDAEDSLLLTRVLREGDSYRVPNREGLTLLTGNAGGIEILVDGRKLPPLGPIGAVRRDIVLDPQLLAQGRTTRQ